MNGEDDRRRLAQEVERALKSGRLPGLDGNIDFQLWGGYGYGEACSLCRREIELDEIEYAVEYEPDVALKFHRWCYDMWRDACARRRS